MVKADYKHFSKCHCGKPALYRVHTQGFCRLHYEESVKAQAKMLNQRKAYAIRKPLMPFPAPF